MATCRGWPKISYDSTLPPGEVLCETLAFFFLAMYDTFHTTSSALFFVFQFLAQGVEGETLSG